MVVMASAMSNGFTAMSPASATCCTRERLDVEARVIGPQQLGCRADVRRAEAGAGPVGDTGVERDADDGDIGVRHLVGAGQAGEGGRTGEPRHLGGIDRSDRLV